MNSWKREEGLLVEMVAEKSYELAVWLREGMEVGKERSKKEC